MFRICYVYLDFIKFGFVVKKENMKTMKKQGKRKNFNDKEKNIKAAATYSTLLTSTQSRSDGESALLLFQQAKLRQLRNALLSARAKRVLSLVCCVIPTTLNLRPLLASRFSVFFFSLKLNQKSQQVKQIKKENIKNNEKTIYFFVRRYE